MAKDLLERLTHLLDLDWRGRTGARSRVVLETEDLLDARLPPVYTKPLYEEKVSKLFDHFYEKYPDRLHNAYART